MALMREEPEDLRDFIRWHVDRVEARQREDSERHQRVTRESLDVFAAVVDRNTQAFAEIALTNRAVCDTNRAVRDELGVLGDELGVLRDERESYLQQLASDREQREAHLQQLAADRAADRALRKDERDERRALIQAVMRLIDRIDRTDPPGSGGQAGS